MKTKARTINISDFKARCLRILEELEPQGIVVLKRGRPIARVIPASSHDNESLIGSMSEQIRIKGDLFSTGVTLEC
jgi:antitoxin (DNA-binding transcriptional repressor) of toxin-antitoxin stability system